MLQCDVCYILGCMLQCIVCCSVTYVAVNCVLQCDVGFSECVTVSVLCVAM